MEDYERREKYRKAIDDMMRIVNDMSFDRELFVNELERQHRTLQQILFGAFLSWCHQLGKNYKDGRWYDLRNEQSCEIACEIVEKILEPRHIEKHHGLMYI